MSTRKVTAVTEQTFDAIRSFLAHEAMDRGDAVRFAGASCRYGAAVFTLSVNEDLGAAWFHCTACDTSYSLHDVPARPFAGSAEDSAEECACTCDRDEFEVVAAVRADPHTCLCVSAAQENLALRPARPEPSA